MRLLSNKNPISLRYRVVKTKDQQGPVNQRGSWESIWMPTGAHGNRENNLLTLILIKNKAKQKASILLNCHANTIHMCCLSAYHKLLAV